MNDLPELISLALTSAPRLWIVGVGGSGCRALNTMISKGLDGVGFLAIDSDRDELASSLAINRKLIELPAGICSDCSAGMYGLVG